MSKCTAPRARILAQVRAWTHRKWPTRTCNRLTKHGSHRSNVMKLRVGMITLIIIQSRVCVCVFKVLIVCYSQMHVKSRLSFFIQTVNSLFSSFRLPLFKAKGDANLLEISEEQQHNRQDAQRAGESEHSVGGLISTCDLNMMMIFHIGQIIP